MSFTMSYSKLYILTELSANGVKCISVDRKKLKKKLRSEVVWHRFFAVPAFIRHFSSYIAVRNLLV